MNASMKALCRVPSLRESLTCVLLVMVTCLALHSSKAQQRQETPKPIQNQTTEPLVLTVTVTDKSGQYIPELERDSFKVLDNNVPQEIIHFDNKEGPISVGIILDASESIFQSRKVNLIKAGIARFIQMSNNSNEYFLLGFNEQPQLVLDWTRDGNAVVDKINLLQVKSATALYDACYLGIEKVMKGAHKKRVLLLISDGGDNNSRFTWKELLAFLKESDVLVYAVGLVNDRGTNSLVVAEGMGVLTDLSLATGGKTLIPETKAVDRAFELIAQELRHQYSISFTAATSTKEREWRSIKVRVTPPSTVARKILPLKARSREGYYAINQKLPLR